VSDFESEPQPSQPSGDPRFADPPKPLELDIPALYRRFERALLGGPRRFTRAEVAAAAGMSSDEASGIWRSLGFATVGEDDVVFTDADVEALRQAQMLVESGIVDEQTRTALTRLLGQSFARLAATQGQLVIDLLAGRPDLLGSEDEVEDYVAALLPSLEQIQTFVWRRQMVAYFARVASQLSAEVTQPGVASTAVGFADLSGFTTLTRRATEHELRELLERFESISTEVVGAHGGRIIKTIGDEVLFVADDASTGAEIALDLVARVERDEQLPPLRVGLAAGPVVSRLGDVYGSTVNIASRLTSLSRPGWVLVDRMVAESLRPDTRYWLKQRRPESVRGFHHLRQWRLGRAVSAPGAPISAGPRR
jgi:adenylate cyclase